jgi:hypothetical protein
MMGVASHLKRKNNLSFEVFTMMKIKLSQKQSNYLKMSLLGIALCGSFQASANATATSPVSTLTTESATLANVYNNIFPVSIGASVFSVGMMLWKRVAYA